MKKSIYYQTKNKKMKKYWSKILLGKSLYFSIGLGIVLGVLESDYLEVYVEHYINELISKKYFAYILVSRNMNYLHEYLLVIGISMMFLCPLIKSKGGHRNLWGIITIGSCSLSLFFFIFSFLKPHVFKNFYLISLTCTIIVGIYDFIKISESIIKWIAPRGIVSADSSKISVIWGILWAILVATVILIWGKKID